MASQVFLKQKWVGCADLLAALPADSEVARYAEINKGPWCVCARVARPMVLPAACVAWHVWPSMACGMCTISWPIVHARFTGQGPRL